MHIASATVLLLSLQTGFGFMPCDSASISSSRRMVASERSEFNILEDKFGHVNRELAERIWTWEQERRQERNLPKLEYSVRAGLRLVEDMVQDIDDVDMIQEGLTALLDAMSDYRSQPDHDFETYAKKRIQERLAEYRNEDRPVKVPAAISEVVERARVLHTKYRSWSRVARELDMPLERLQQYAQLANRKTLLSMERTVEVRKPWLDDRVQTVDQDVWELQSGKLLDNGEKVQKDELVEDYLDETINTEGDDDSYIQQEQIAGRLQDVIPSDDPSPDDIILQELIESDLQSFLRSALNEQEITVIRSAYGLGDTPPQSAQAIAKTIQVKPSEVRVILETSLKKLRESYVQRFVQDDEDDEDFIIESV
jgi:RNA polymerase sigma factor (sigma-70 family)